MAPRSRLPLHRRLQATLEVAQSETMQGALQPFRQRRCGKDELPRSLAGVAGRRTHCRAAASATSINSARPATIGEYGREEGVMRASENEAIAAAIVSVGSSNFANAIDKRRVVEVSLRTRRPVGAGHDVDQHRRHAVARDPLGVCYVPWIPWPARRFAACVRKWLPVSRRARRSGNSWLRRTESRRAAAVAVLHATTIIEQPCATR